MVIIACAQYIPLMKTRSSPAKSHKRLFGYQRASLGTRFSIDAGEFAQESVPRLALLLLHSELLEQGWAKRRGGSQVEVSRDYSYHPSRDPLRDPAALLILVACNRTHTR